MWSFAFIVSLLVPSDWHDSRVAMIATLVWMLGWSAVLLVMGANR
jgi:vacuolar-type H+-ATPase subunit I/STV1